MRPDGAEWSALCAFMICAAAALALAAGRSDSAGPCSPRRRLPDSQRLGLSWVAQEGDARPAWGWVSQVGQSRVGQSWDVSDPRVCGICS